MNYKENNDIKQERLLNVLGSLKGDLEGVNLSKEEEPLAINEEVKNGLPENRSEFKRNESVNENLFIEGSPYVPNWLFKELPLLLKDSCALFDNHRERDIFLVGALGVISGCLQNTEGLYDGRKVFSNIFTFVSAPPANGKGVLMYAKKFGLKYHKSILEENKRLQKDYDEKLALYNKGIKKGKFDIEMPNKISTKTLFIPADSSLARIVQHLQMNSGEGIIFETESDSMSIAQSKEWGYYSHLLRLAFHHETYSLSRKGGNEYIEIETPKISVVLTGTPSQIPKLIESIDDGLFSRFVYYKFEAEIVWKDIFNYSNRSLDKEFEFIEERSFKMIKFLESSPTKLKLTFQQEKSLNAKFYTLLQNTISLYGESASSIVLRLGLITYKFCMILTAINKAENGDLTTEIECSDNDFEIAIALSETFLMHSLKVFSTISKSSSKTNNRFSYRNQILNDLPHEFERADAVALARKHNVSERTVDTLLRNELGVSINKKSNGIYKKL